MSARTERIAELYERHAASIERQVSRRARAPRAVIEDATREAWKLSSRQREVPIGGWSSEPGEGELPEPAGETADPLTVAIDHEHSREFRDRLAGLNPRERQFLALQAAGLTYEEISQTGASVRTVERLILRGRRKLRDGRPSIDD